MAGSDKRAQPWREVARYAYVDEHGALLSEVIRLQRADGTKRFIQQRPSGVEAAGTTDSSVAGGVPTGGIVLGLSAGKYSRDKNAERRTGKPIFKRVENEGAIEIGEPVYSFRECRRVLYHLDSLLSADVVYLPEGEKDVHTLEAWGVTASCNSGGAGSSELYGEWGPVFNGKHVNILPDNDEPGRKHALRVAEILLPVAASVRIVELPDLPEKGDISDWRDQGGTPENLQELVNASPALDVNAIQELRARWGLEDKKHNSGASAGDESWPAPAALQSELPPVEPFVEDLLPVSFRDFVRDVAYRMQVAIDFAAAIMILCLAGVVNRRAVIQPKALDYSWRIVPNLWGAIIAPPGLLKSPLIHAITRPLIQIQADYLSEYQNLRTAFALAKEAFDLRVAAWKELYKSSAKMNRAIPPRPDGEPVEPKLRRLVLNDATFEATHVTMSENPAGILVIRDELPGWWAQLDRPGREGERAFCLEAWNGNTGFTTDRIGRGMIHVPACCMSMLGGIQPARLRSYLGDALRDGPANDGLIQRFQVIVYPDTNLDWEYVDQQPRSTAENIVGQVLRTLVDLDPLYPVQLRFAADAQSLFVEWLAELEHELRSDDLHPAVIAHLSKYRSLMPSLAALFELADWAAVGKGKLECVSLENTKRAAAMCAYLESHARRVYSCVTTPQMRSAQELAEKIKKRKIGTEGTFSCREVYLKGWAGLDTPELVRQAAEVLTDAYWIRPVADEPGPMGGRASERFEINPAVRP